MTLIRHALISAGDFSGPAPSLTFKLGSSIPIRATVEPRSHRPLRIYLESCVLANDADIRRATRVHPIIANTGYELIGWLWFALMRQVVPHH